MPTFDRQFLNFQLSKLQEKSETFEWNPKKLQLNKWLHTPFKFLSNHQHTQILIKVNT